MTRAKDVEKFEALVSGENTPPNSDPIAGKTSASSSRAYSWLKARFSPGMHVTKPTADPTANPKNQPA